MNVPGLSSTSVSPVFVAASICRYSPRLVASASHAITPMTLPHVSAVGKTRFRSLTSAGLQFNSHVLKPPVSGEQPRSSPTSKEEAAPLRNEECRNSPISQFKWPESGGSFQSFDPIFVRDSCSCRRCVDPSTTQKTFETANIPGNIRAEHVDVQADGRAYITWEPDVPGFENHVSIYEASFGIRNANLESRLEATYNVPGPRIAWRRNTVIQNRLSVQYNEFMAQDRILLSSLDQLYRYGLLFISSVPSHSGSVSSLARRIGPLKSTLYGPTWDVKSVPSAKNVAYTSSDLGFHMVRRTRMGTAVSLKTSTGPALRGQSTRRADPSLLASKHARRRESFQ